MFEYRVEWPVNPYELEKYNITLEGGKLCLPQQRSDFKFLYPNLDLNLCIDGSMLAFRFPNMTIADKVLFNRPEQFRFQTECVFDNYEVLYHSSDKAC